MRIDKKKIKFFEKTLADFFRKAGRTKLPWRPQKTVSRGTGKITAYEVWVSEIMLQQTQVVRVVDYYRKFLKRFSTVQALAQASWEEFLPYYEGLGYYTRGRNMLKAAQVVVQGYRGKFPHEKKLLERLPGVGPYTAAAIMSFAYGDNHLAWDTNLKRVIGRFFLGGKHLVTDEAWWDDKFATPKQSMNAALMDFGSALCVARPKCEACSLRSHCLYYQEQGKQEASNSATAFRASRIIKKKVDWNRAQVLLFLHENHQKYFSANKRQFQPFLVTSGYNTRAGIKKYFQERYGLTLSVRPPHQKQLRSDIPTLLVNAQILLGESKFAIFSKNDVREYNEGTLKKLPSKKLKS
ncbi:MAG: hypothetical protein Q8O53_00035 [Candidatus Moranbacteria bacterium]|nr:hypothetical protein [Candidatus Moranbacteria bacterium]